MKTTYTEPQMEVVFIFLDDVIVCSGLVTPIDPADPVSTYGIDLD